MRERWHKLADRLNARESADPLFDALDALYAHPPRPYHNLTHIAACLDLLDQHRNLTKQPEAVELALWMHDCVYVPGRKDNEERSAKIARVFANQMNIDAATTDAIEQWILATRHTSAPTTPDESLILDIDMSILAAAPADYDTYTRNIRTEFAFATDEQFKAGRGAFLRTLLTHPAIFFTPELHARFEQPARANIQRELAAIQ
ncbi:MAG: hypothetical protein QM783_01275 [Phycisphaerales bacterium]